MNNVRYFRFNYTEAYLFLFWINKILFIILDWEYKTSRLLITCILYTDRQKIEAELFLLSIVIWEWYDKAFKHNAVYALLIFSP